MVDQKIEYTHIVDGAVQFFKVTLLEIVVLHGYCYFIVVHDHSLLVFIDLLHPLSYSNFVNTLRDSI